MPFVPDLAAHDAACARRAAGRRDRDDFRDAEPGKILHELRHGELTALRPAPHSPYYGTADATPLFLVAARRVRALDRRRATRSGELEPQARAALRLDRGARRPDGDGFVEYQHPKPDSRAGQPVLEGLLELDRPPRRHAWPTPPHALLRDPGVRLRRTDAHRPARRARSGATRRCARRLGAEPRACAPLRRSLLVEDGRLRARPGRRRPPVDYAHVEHGPPAVERDRRPDERATTVHRAADGDALFSGWGVRTHGRPGQPAYNPLEYHNGTVWPHDNSLIAAGLARYDRREESGRMTVARSARLRRSAAGFPRLRGIHRRRSRDCPWSTRPRFAAGVGRRHSAAAHQDADGTRARS